MIRSLEVKGLNNRNDGNFNFHFHEDLNIFTGANGSGKTTLLKLLWYLISGNLQQIVHEIPFNFILIRTDSFSLTVTYAESHRIKFDCGFNQRKNSSSIVANLNRETGAPAEYTDTNKFVEITKKIVGGMKSSLFFPTFRRVESRFSDLSHYYVPIGDGAMSSASRSLALNGIQEALSLVSDALSVEEHKFIASISTEDLRELLTQKYADIYEKINNRQSQVLEDISKEIQNNPNKDKISEIPQDASAVLDAIEKVNEERERLSKPLSVLSELSRKILRYNAIRVTGRVAHGETTDGITLEEGRDGITVGEAKDAISSDKLSAGEKQMLSFLCYNAFSADTAIFIDEPELSLHIDWQRLLLPTLLDQSTGNQFFIATHSPFIFTGYQHKEIPLKSD